MNFQNRQQVLGLAAAVLLGVLAGERWVIAPLTKAWKGRSEEITRLQKVVEKGDALLRKEASLRDTWNRMRTNTLSPDGSIAENQMLKAFDVWSRTVEVGVGGVRPQRKEGEEFSTVECRADVSGSLQSLTRFLFEVEQDPLGIRVESLNLTTRDSGGSQLTMGLLVSGLQLNQRSR